MEERLELKTQQTRERNTRFAEKKKRKERFKAMSEANPDVVAMLASVVSVHEEKSKLNDNSQGQTNALQAKVFISLHRSTRFQTLSKYPRTKKK